MTNTAQKRLGQREAAHPAPLPPGSEPGRWAASPADIPSPRRFPPVGDGHLRGPQSLSLRLAPFLTRRRRGLFKGGV